MSALSFSMFCEFIKKGISYVKLDNDVLKQIKAISALKGKSMNSLITEILKEYLKRYKIEIVEQNPEKEK